MFCGLHTAASASMSCTAEVYNRGSVIEALTFHLVNLGSTSVVSVTRSGIWLTLLHKSRTVLDGMSDSCNDGAYDSKKLKY